MSKYIVKGADKIARVVSDLTSNSGEQSIIFNDCEALIEQIWQDNKIVSERPTKYMKGDVNLKELQYTGKTGYSVGSYSYVYYITVD